MVPIGTPRQSDVSRRSKTGFCNLETFGEDFDLKGTILIRAKTAQKFSTHIFAPAGSGGQTPVKEAL